MRKMLIAVALAACSDKSIAIGDLANKWLAAQCANDVTCQQMPDPATCQAAYQFETQAFETKVADVKAKLIKYDAAAAGKWIDSIASQSCVFAGWHTADLSVGVFTGTIAAGGNCFIDEECAGTGSTCAHTDPSCNPGTTCCPGTCAAAPAKQQLGAACNSSAQCADGLYCADDTSQCRALAANEGDTCHAIDGCANPMSCNEDFTTFTGTCITPPASNATCDPMSLYPCADERDYCDQTSLKCTRSAPVSAACNDQTGPSCVGYAVCSNATCTARPKAGETCMGGGPTCLGDLQCSSAMTGTCTLAAAGTSCR